MKGKKNADAQANNKLYLRIRDFCDILGWSDAELARRAEIRQGVLTDLKYSRKQSLSSKNLMDIAAALGISVDSLIGDPDVSGFEAPPDLWQLDEMEQNLIRCWRNATDDEKEAVVFALRKHNIRLPK